MMPDSTRLIIVAIGGPTCSGKTTLAKALSRVIPRAKCLFQDDFAPPAEQVPMHPVHQVQDWDDPDGAIEWKRQRETLQYLRKHGEFPSAHYSHDHLNAQIPVPMSEDLQRHWRERFETLAAELERRDEGSRVDFVIADGFLMFYDEASVKEFDVRLFVREGYDELKRRRHERHGYHTAEGALWRDPPEYWDNIVWPAYLKAHRKLFVNGDVEHGPVDETAVEGVDLLEASRMSMDELLQQSCEQVYDRVKSGLTAKDYSRP